MNKYNKIGFVNGSAPALNADNLNHMDEGIEQMTDGAITLETEITTARGDYADLIARFSADESNISQLASDAETTATTLATKANKSDISQINSRLQNAETTLNYKANATDVDNSLAKKEDNSNKVSSKSSVTSKSGNYPSIEYLENNYYDFTELYVSDEVDDLLADKYNSSNIESGSSTLTPYSSQTDKSKSAVCTYKKVGDTVFATVSITLNAGTLGANSTLHFIDLPFRHNSDTPVYFTGISSKGGVFKGVVPKTSTWLSIMSTVTQTYTFTDGEQLNFSLMYKI